MSIDDWTLVSPTLQLDDRAGRLRSWTKTANDVAALHAAWHDPQIMRWNSVPPEPTLDLAEQWIGGVRARLDGHVSIDLAIEIDGKVVGEIGVAGIDRARRAGFVGYWVLAERRGEGLAGSALRTFGEWALGTGGFQLLVARCDAANLASQRTAAAAGFGHEMTEADGSLLWTRRRKDS